MNLYKEKGIMDTSIGQKRKTDPEKKGSNSASHAHSESALQQILKRLRKIDFKISCIITIILSIALIWAALVARKRPRKVEAGARYLGNELEIKALKKNQEELRRKISGLESEIRQLKNSKMCTVAPSQGVELAEEEPNFSSMVNLQKELLPKIPRFEKAKKRLASSLDPAHASYIVNRTYHYTGEWKNGKFDGFGVLVGINGEGYYYEGQFSEGQIYRFGRLIRSDGSYDEGYFVTGELLKGHPLSHALK